MYPVFILSRTDFDYFKEQIKVTLNSEVFYKFSELNKKGEFDFTNIQYSVDNENWHLSAVSAEFKEKTLKLEKIIKTNFYSRIKNLSGQTKRFDELVLSVEGE